MKNILPCELNVALDCAKSLYELKTHKFNIERIGANMHYTSDIMGTTFVLVEDDFEHTETAVDVIVDTNSKCITLVRESLTCSSFLLEESGEPYDKRITLLGRMIQHVLDIHSQDEQGLKGWALTFTGEEIEKALKK